MAAQRFEHFPYDRISLIIIKRLIRCHTGRNHNGKNDIAKLLAFKLPHHAADGLDNVDLRFLGLQEDDGVKTRNIDAFCKAAGI